MLGRKALCPEIQNESFFVNYRVIDYRKICNFLELFAKEVMPQFR